MPLATRTRGCASLLWLLRRCADAVPPHAVNPAVRRCTRRFRHRTSETERPALPSAAIAQAHALDRVALLDPWPPPTDPDHTDGDTWSALAELPSLVSLEVGGLDADVLAARTPGDTLRQLTIRQLRLWPLPHREADTVRRICGGTPLLTVRVEQVAMLLPGVDKWVVGEPPTAEEASDMLALIAMLESLGWRLNSWNLEQVEKLKAIVEGTWEP